MSGLVQRTQLTNAAIAEYAGRVGQHHQIYDAQGRADIAELVQKLGGNITTSPNMFAPESLVIERPGAFRIILPPAASARRDRFAVAHELGHYFLHYRLPGLDGTAVFRRGTRDRTEAEATIFASSLLMPASQFRQIVEQHGGNWHAIAAVFEVSPRAAAARARMLHITPGA